MSDLTITLDGFEDYVVTTTPTPTAFLAFAGVYVGLFLCVIAPLVTFCSRRYSKTRPEESSVVPVDPNNVSPATEGNNRETVPATPEQEMVTLQNRTNCDTHGGFPNGVNRPKEQRLSHADIMNANNTGGSDNGGEAIAANTTTPCAVAKGGTAQRIIHSDPQVSNFPQDFRAPNADQMSGVPSAATTSRLRESSSPQDALPPTGRKRTNRAWEAASMGWKHRRPIGRIEARERSVRSERQSQISEDESVARSRASWNSRPGSQVPSRRGMSDLAGSILEVESVRGEAEYYRQRYRQRARHRRRLSTSTSERSVMPPLSPDALAPEDAADAHDPGITPGTANYLGDDDEEEETIEWCWPFGTVCSAILDLAEPDFETRRILSLAIPTTISAVSEPLFRIVLVAIISHFIDTDSMVAFVLVILFVRITMEELSAAVTDTETILVQNAFAEGGDYGFYQVGQQVQLAVIMQVLIGVPVLVTWAYIVDDVVLWLVDSSNIASLASDYTQIIVIDYVVQATCRTFMLVFHLSGNDRFDSNIDLSATLFTVLAIAIIVGYDDSSTLVSIGWVQVAIGVAKTLVKFAYVVKKGWVEPYRRGLLGRLSLRDGQAVRNFLDISFPLFIGSLIELREWELLTLCVRCLGSAEVAAWALMGIMWEVFEASTEGIGDAAAIRVSFLLVEGEPVQAKILSNKVAFLAGVEALLATSIFLMAGPNITVSLTTDSTLENLLNDLVGMTGLANVAMAFAQVYWSLVGAQDRFGLASSTILLCRWLVTMPLAFYFIFGLSYDLRAVAGSIAVGYATASSFLAYCVYQSDWHSLSVVAHEEAYLDENMLDFSVEGGEDEGEESDSEDDGIY